MVTLFDDCNGGGDLFLLYCFPTNKKIMDAPSVMPKDDEDNRPYYTFNLMIINFQSEMDVSFSKMMRWLF